MYIVDWPKLNRYRFNNDRGGNVGHALFTRGDARGFTRGVRRIVTQGVIRGVTRGVT